MEKIVDKIFKITIYLLVFLFPIFFLPFTFEFYEFNKIYLLFYLLSFAFLVWFGKTVFLKKEFVFKRTPLDIFVFLFLASATLSTVFSVDKNSSLFGFYGRFSNGLFPIYLLALFYFLLINESQTLNLKILKNVFFFSLFLLSLSALFSIFNLWQKIPSLPPVFRLRTFNFLSGSFEGLALFLTFSVSLLVGEILISERKKDLILYFFFLIPPTLLLVFIDFWVCWLILILSFSVYLFLALRFRLFKENVNRLLLPIVFILISFFFLFFNTAKVSPLFAFPKEKTLEQSYSLKSAFGTWKENLKSIFFGSGVGTFYYDFAKFKPKEFNQTPWWQVRYDRAGSFITEIFGTMGIFGILSYLALAVVFLLLSYFLLAANHRLVSPSFLAFLTLFLAGFFYYQNLPLAFGFWLALALGVSSFEKSSQEIKISFQNFPELNLIFSSIFIAAVFGMVVLWFFATKFYLADLKCAKSFLVPSLPEKGKFLEEATKLNPYLSAYRIFLSQNYLAQIFEETQKPPANQDLGKIQNLTATAIDQAKFATERLSPNNVAAWENLAIVYREIQTLAAGATDWAIKSFEKALKLEPKNPALLTELGKLYFIKDEGKAKECFSRAVEMKPDFSPAQIQLALVFEKEGNLEEATKILEKVVNENPTEIEARFQLGRIYYNKRDLEKAQAEFENVLQVFPNHSNSLYSLGLIWKEKGDKEKALSYFKKVLDLNPGNPEVIKKIEELEATSSQK